MSPAKKVPLAKKAAPAKKTASKTFLVVKKRPAKQSTPAKKAIGHVARKVAPRVEVNVDYQPVQPTKTIKKSSR